jgi:hypothetical protein
VVTRRGDNNGLGRCDSNGTYPAENQGTIGLLYGWQEVQNGFEGEGVGVRGCFAGIVLYSTT